MSDDTGSGVARGTVKHTPEPWEWVVDKWNGGYSGIVGRDGIEVLFPNSRNDGDIGAAWFEDFPSPQDASLIISAPDLLAVAKEAALFSDYVDTVLGGDGKPWSIEDMQNLANDLNGQARAVIKKVEGTP